MNMDTQGRQPALVIKIYITIINTKFFHETLDLLFFIIFQDIAMTDADDQALLEMQTEKAIIGSMAFIPKDEMALQDAWTFCSFKYNDAVVILYTLNTIAKYLNKDTYININTKPVFPKEGNKIRTTRYNVPEHHEFTQVACLRILVVLSLQLPVI